MEHVHLLTTEAEIARCLPVLRQLRIEFNTAEDLLLAMQPLRAEGVQIAALEHKGEIATVALFRVHHMLVSGLTLYVDDLVTAEQFRSHGYGQQMVQWLQDWARNQGCRTFSLDCGTFRESAHAFYFREGLRITSFHFAKDL